jgi:hypothetical protein
MVEELYNDEKYNDQKKKNCIWTFSIRYEDMTRKSLLPIVREEHPSRNSEIHYLYPYVPLLCYFLPFIPAMKPSEDLLSLFVD